MKHPSIGNGPASLHSPVGTSLGLPDLLNFRYHENQKLCVTTIIAASRQTEAWQPPAADETGASMDAEHGPRGTELGGFTEAAIPILASPVDAKFPLNISLPPANLLLGLGESEAVGVHPPIYCIVSFLPCIREPSSTPDLESCILSSNSNSAPFVLRAIHVRIVYAEAILGYWPHVWRILLVQHSIGALCSHTLSQHGYSILAYW